jgi:hypothetical protein
MCRFSIINLLKSKISYFIPKVGILPQICETAQNSLQQVEQRE